MTALEVARSWLAEWLEAHPEWLGHASRNDRMAAIRFTVGRNMRKPWSGEVRSFWFAEDVPDQLLQLGTDEPLAFIFAHYVPDAEHIEATYIRCPACLDERPARDTCERCDGFGGIDPEET